MLSSKSPPRELVLYVRFTRQFFKLTLSLQEPSSRTVRRSCRLYEIETRRIRELQTQLAAQKIVTPQVRELQTQLAARKIVTPQVRELQTQLAAQKIVTPQVRELQTQLAALQAQRDEDLNQLRQSHLDHERELRKSHESELQTSSETLSEQLEVEREGKILAEQSVRSLEMKLAAESKRMEDLEKEMRLFVEGLKIAEEDLVLGGAGAAMDGAENYDWDYDAGDWTRTRPVAPFGVAWDEDLRLDAGAEAAIKEQLQTERERLQLNKGEKVAKSTIICVIRTSSTTLSRRTKQPHPPMT